jgi:hypothetical protein
VYIFCLRKKPYVYKKERRGLSNIHTQRVAREYLTKPRSPCYNGGARAFCKTSPGDEPTIPHFFSPKTNSPNVTKMEPKALRGTRHDGGR